MSEIHTDAIKKAQVVGNPGCYATSIILPLVPLIKAGILNLDSPLVAIGYSGVSGAGKKFIESNNNLFYALNENLHSYRPVGHQHTGEIDQELTLAAGKPVHLSFVPHLAPITRGIHTTITATLAAGKTSDHVLATWANAYGKRPFVRIRKNPKDVEVANTTGTNFIDIAAAHDGQTLIITSAEDNLVKGASGQAIQNLNLLFGFDETAGLLHRGI